MAEYIAREALLRDIERHHVSDGKFQHWVQVQPAADVAPVVRCKDCKHRVYKYINEEIGEIGGCELFNRAMPNDDFCSYGERKDGEP